jgi:tetratricopeptide (TPR) repeat protein
VFAGGWLWRARSTPSIGGLRRLCRDAVRARQWSALQASSERWTAIAPESGEAWVFLAEACQQQQQFEQALQCLDRVPESAPEAEAALTAQMELQFGPLNRPREGAETCERILSRNPQSLVARQRLIFFLTMTLQRVRLIHEIRRALDSGTEPREAYVYLFFADSLRFDNGAELNGQWLSHDPESELFEVGEAIFIAETLDASVSMDDREAAQAARRALARKGPVMEQLLKKYPHNAELLAYQLRESVLTGNVSRAVELLAQAPADAEEDNRFWRFKGWVRAQRGELAAAESDYRHALELHPLDWGTRHLLAELLQRQQRPEEVARLRELVNRANALRRAIHLAPSASRVPPPTLVELATYAADCGDAQMAAALRHRLKQYYDASQPPSRNAK